MFHPSSTSRPRAATTTTPLSSTSRRRVASPTSPPRAASPAHGSTAFLWRATSSAQPPLSSAVLFPPRPPASQPHALAGRPLARACFLHRRLHQRPTQRPAPASEDRCCLLRPMARAAALPWFRRSRCQCGFPATLKDVDASLRHRRRATAVDPRCSRRRRRRPGRCWKRRRCCLRRRRCCLDFDDLDASVDSPRRCWRGFVEPDAPGCWPRWREARC